MTRVVGSKTGPGGSCEVTIGDLTEEEADRLQACFVGSTYICVMEDKIHSFPLYREFPDPVDDPKISPHWDSLFPLCLEETLQQPTPISDWETPAIIVSHLCGYSYSQHEYQCQAAKFQRWGFVCLRSRRGPDGLYWELWYLPYLEAAQGELKEACGPSSVSLELRLRALREFICRNASFGTMDICAHRIGMSIE